MNRLLKPIFLIAMLSVFISTTVAEQVSIVNTEGSSTGTIIPIQVSDVKNGIGSATIKLSYNPDVIQIENVSAGDLPYVVSNINNSIGKTVIVAFTGYRINKPVVTIANVRLKSGIEKDTSSLTMEVETLGDSSGNPIAHTLGTGTAVVDGDIINVNWKASKNIQMPVPNPEHSVPTEPGAYAIVDGKAKKVKTGDIIARGEKLPDGGCRINYSVGVRGNAEYQKGDVITRVNDNCEAAIEEVNISYKGGKENKIVNSKDVITASSSLPVQGWAKHEMGHLPLGQWPLTAVTTSLKYYDDGVSTYYPYNPTMSTFIYVGQMGPFYVDWWHLSGSGISRWGDTIGDSTLDDTVDITDALFIAQYISGSRAFSLHQIEESDTNCDGQITSTDANYIGEYTVGLRARLGCKVVIHSWGEFYATPNDFSSDPINNRHTLNPTFYGKPGIAYANFCELQAVDLYWTLSDRCSGGIGQPP